MGHGHGPSTVRASNASEWETITGYTQCDQAIKVKKNDVVTMTSLYDVPKHKLLVIKPPLLAVFGLLTNGPGAPVLQSTLWVVWEVWERKGWLWLTSSLLQRRTSPQTFKIVDDIDYDPWFKMTI
jgi:hypothetical protein